MSGSGDDASPVLKKLNSVVFSGNSVATRSLSWLVLLMTWIEGGRGGKERAAGMWPTRDRNRYVTKLRYNGIPRK